MKILLISYDNDSYTHVFPSGLAYIASVLKKNNHKVHIYEQDKNHYSENHLTEYLNQNKFDVVGIGVIGGYYQFRKLLKISNAILSSKNRPFYIIGGHGPSPDPEYFLKKTGANVVVIGEGEETIIDLLENIKTLDKVKGIAYIDGNKLIQTERRPPIQDIDAIPFPAYDMFSIDYYRLLRLPRIKATDFSMTMLSGRGCPFTCNFCYRMDPGFRARSNESIIDEIKFLKEKYSINRISFMDELLMSSKARTISLCESFIKNNIGIEWDCNGRLNFATKEILSLMKRAGCVFINYGIEALDDQVLKNMNKCLNVDQIIKGIEITLEVGISPGFNVIFGNIGDDKETLKKGVDFLIKYDDGAQLRTIRPVTPYPGSPLYYHAISKGLLKDSQDFYENKHTNSDLMSINFTNMTDEEFHKELFAANKQLLENYFSKKLKDAINEATSLYINKNSNFRGFRQI